MISYKGSSSFIDVYTRVYIVFGFCLNFNLLCCSCHCLKRLWLTAFSAMRVYESFVCFRVKSMFLIWLMNVLIKPTNATNTNRIPKRWLLTQHLCCGGLFVKANWSNSSEISLAFNNDTTSNISNEKGNAKKTRKPKTRTKSFYLNDTFNKTN